jgi:hypothetical protein
MIKVNQRVLNEEEKPWLIKMIFLENNQKSS